MTLSLVTLCQRYFWGYGLLIFSKTNLQLWLDSNYPPNGDPNKPGVARGPCSTSSGVPSEVESQQPDATVRFSNIKIGPIGSTTL